MQILRAGGHVSDRDGLTDMTVLHYACKSGARGMGSNDEACRAVSLLLQEGADPYIRCRWTNMAAIHYAAYFDVASVAAILLAATKGIGRLCFVPNQYLVVFCTLTDRWINCGGCIAADEVYLCSSQTLLHCFVHTLYSAQRERCTR